MLYLFGRLALSDSLDYSENSLDDDYRPAAHSERAGRPEAATQPAAPDQRRLASRPGPPASSACAGCLAK